ncbi:MAG TPA: arginine N-succinyltransferase [Candidatus Binataceae bacterium]|nr:arginine N-succinyltransferase [Candidatus Binataceae bacterium]
MDAATFLLREAREGDHQQLLTLARELDSINLPTDPAELTEALIRSAHSFRGRICDHSRAAYIFVAEAAATGAIVAASMIIAKHGTPEAPHYYLQIDSEERYSRTLRKKFRHDYLRLRYSMDGPTEIGGLIVSRAMRGHSEHIGKQISWVRFLYMALNPSRFEPQVIAEMLAPMLPGHRNLFWDHYGGRITGLSFQEADILSIRDKEFIHTLFPDSPLYTFLLPDEVRKSIGMVGESSRGAVRLLEQAGMKFIGHIDPFDAGPYYGAALADLVPTRELRSSAAIAGQPASEHARSRLVSCNGTEGFRAIRADTELRDDGILLSADQLAMLGVEPGTPVDTVPLPERNATASPSPLSSVPAAK